MMYCSTNMQEMDPKMLQIPKKLIPLQCLKIEEDID